MESAQCASMTATFATTALGRGRSASRSPAVGDLVARGAHSLEDP